MRNACTVCLQYSAAFVSVETELTNQGEGAKDIMQDMMVELPLRFLSGEDTAIGQILPVLERERPDAVLTDALAIAGRVAARLFRVPLIMLHIRYACNASFSITSSWSVFTDTHPARTEANRLIKAICFGVPMLAFPQMDEQFFSASLVEKHGLGKMIPDRNRITPELVRESIGLILAYERYELNVKRFMDDMRHDNGGEESPQKEFFIS